MTDALSVVNLEKATRLFAAQPALTDKLGWWLLRAHSSERWVQFEWAYQLSKVLDTKYAVLCEKNWVDIVLVQLPAPMQPLWNNRPAGGIELKWFGNWWFDPNSGEVAEDVRKVESYAFPAIALAMWLFVRPKPGAHGYDWIIQQVDGRRRGSCEPPQVREARAHRVGRAPDTAVSVACDRGPKFEAVELVLFGFRNLVQRE